MVYIEIHKSGNHLTWIYTHNDSITNFSTCHYYASNVFANDDIKIVDIEETTKLLRLFKRNNIILDIDNAVPKGDDFDNSKIAMLLEEALV